MGVINHFERSYKELPKTLKTGDQAPDFEALLVDGRTVPLSQLIERGPLMLNFIRGTWCMFCRSHMGSVHRWLKEVRKNVTVLVVTNEDLDRVREWKAKEQMSYLMASDPEQSIIKKFGLELTDEEFARPAVFLIDKDQQIRMAHYAKRTNVIQKTEKLLKEA